MLIQTLLRAAQCQDKKQQAQTKIQDISLHIRKKKSFLEVNTGATCPERLRSLWPWRYSKPNWSGHCATCSCRPCFGQEVGLDNLLWFHPPSVGLWLWTGTPRGAPAAVDRGPVATWISFLARPLMKLEICTTLFMLPTLYQSIKSNFTGQHWEWLREGTRMCNSSSLLEMHHEKQVYLNCSLALDCWTVCLDYNNSLLILCFFSCTDILLTV